MRKKIITMSIVCSMILGATTLQSQGDAGRENIFTVGGVGARAIGLGNAYVAMPSDATAIYWNPAGMEYVQKKSLTLFYTNLLAGAQYSFLGYVHPTLNFGTIGVGTIRVGTGGIKVKDEDNFGDEITDYYESQFLVSYAKQLPFNLSAGISLKLHYFSLWEKTDSGFGADIGLLYRPNFSSVILQQLSIGMNLHNILQPRLNPGEATDVHPYSLKFGIAKPFSFSGGGNQVVFYLDFEQGGANSPFRYHSGTEYIFQDHAMLRLGVNNSQIAFGAGVNYSMFQLDYSYGKFADHELNASHRVSFTVNLGKSKDELIQIAKEKRLQEINRQLARRFEYDRNEKIAKAMENGKRFLEEEDYLRAQREFNIVLDFEEQIPDAIEIRQAKELLKFTEDKYKEQIEKAYAEIQARTEHEKKLEEDRIFINEHFQKGLTLYENEEYAKAIDEWKKILEREPEHQLAKEYIRKAEVDYSQKIYNLIQQADALGKTGKFVEAINVLNRAIGLNPDNDKIRDAINTRRAQYENRLSFYDLYQQGRNFQIRKEYKQAMDAYERALQVDPNNSEVKKRYEEVKARHLARSEPLPGPARVEFLKGLRLINEGQYQNALEILEGLQRSNPYNKEILDAIDTARELIEKQKRNQNQK